MRTIAFPFALSAAALLASTMPSSAHFQMLYGGDSALVQGGVDEMLLVFTHPFSGGPTMAMGQPEAFYVRYGKGDDTEPVETDLLPFLTQIARKQSSRGRSLSGQGRREGKGLSMIETRNVRAGYGDGADILHGISIRASSREIVTILGPNGCGKSTLLKTIAGFVRPRHGEVILDGQDVSNVPISQKVRKFAVGYVPQTDNVFATLSVAENIRLGAQHLPAEERESRYAALMDQYPSLASKQNRKASALSGGERQILSLVRALISNPRILLLDEPSAGLSPLMMHEVFDAIAGIRDNTNMCILMVEQNGFEALGIADRAYVLTLGNVAIESGAQELLSDPAMRRLYLGGSLEPAA